MSENTINANFIELTAEIVSAYVSNNTVAAAEIPALIHQVFGALSRVSGMPGDAAAEPLKPAVSVKKSITPEHIVCLEDGKKFKSLKRHLRTQYNMTPEQLRQAVKLAKGRAKTEASGGVNLQTIRAIAQTGVDFISVGAITHSARAVDIGLDFEINS